MLIGLVGKKGVGKDTVADYIVQQHGFVKRAFADPIKEACTIIFQLAPEQLSDRLLKEKVDERFGMSPRKMMQWLGTDVVRQQIRDDFWVQHFMAWYTPGSNVVVPDIRFQDELDAVKRLGGIVIRITRPGAAEDKHISETGVDSLTGVHEVVCNDSSITELWLRCEVALSRCTATR